METYSSKTLSNTNYEIDHLLGNGAFGVAIKVWNVKKWKRLDRDTGNWENEESRTPLVIKRTFVSISFNPFDTLTQEEVKATEKEIKALEKLKGHEHPNIVQFISAEIETPPKGWVEMSDPYWSYLRGGESTSIVGSWGSGDENHYRICPVSIVQEFCDKGSLKDWLESGTNNDQRTFCSLNFAKQISDGLRYLHQKGLVHRDLKPENVFLNENEQGKIVLKIGDFGLSKVMNEKVKLAEGNLTKNNEMEMTEQIGTPIYMGPEQEGTNYGNQVDIYALGVITLELFVVAETRGQMRSIIYMAKSLSSEEMEEDYEEQLDLFVNEVGASSFLTSSIVKEIYKMLQTFPQDRPTASEVYNFFLSECCSSIPFPIRYIYLHSREALPEPQPSINSSSFNEIFLQLNSTFYGEENNFVVLSGSSSLAEQMALSFFNLLGDDCSKIWIDSCENEDFNKVMDSIGGRMFLHLRDDSNFETHDKDVITLVHKVLEERNSRLIVVINDMEIEKVTMGEGSQYHTIIHLWKMGQMSNSTTVLKPFLLVTSQRKDVWKFLLEIRDRNCDPKGFYPHARMPIEALWKDTKGFIPPIEIKLADISN